MGCQLEAMKRSIAFDSGQCAPWLGREMAASTTTMVRRVLRDTRLSVEAIWAPSESRRPEGIDRVRGSRGLQHPGVENPDDGSQLARFRRQLDGS